MASRQIGPAAWAAPASVTISDGIVASGAGIGNVPIELDKLQIDYSVFAINVVDLVLGDNTITIPIGSLDVKATVCYIVPPSGNTTALTLKGAGADTGIAMNPQGINRLTFPTTSPPTSFIVNAAAALANVRFYFF